MLALLLVQIKEHMKKIKVDVLPLMLVRCACYSVQLAVLHAAADYLPEWLELLLGEA